MYQSPRWRALSERAAPSRLARRGSQVSNMQVSEWHVPTWRPPAAWLGR
jgi:hypothetical protein